MCPPRTAIIARFKGLLTDHVMPLRIKIFMSLKSLYQLAIQGNNSLLCTIDDLVFHAYRTCEFVNPVFIVGGFRTGSTTLHRVLALDEERYVSPRFLELCLPFIWMHYWFDAVEWFDKKTGAGITFRLERALQAWAGPDVMARHPMSLKIAEECDAMFSTVYWSGYYAILLCPLAESWEGFGGITNFSEGEKAFMASQYRRCMQKVLFRRGNDRTLLSKSHLIDCMDMWAKEFPGAKFIDIIRHPRDVVPSWVALAQPFSSIIIGWKMPLPAAVDAHLKFWDVFYAKERLFFKDGKCNKSSRAVLKFRPFVKDQISTMRSLYEQFGFPFEGTDFQRRILAEQAAMKAYKKAHAYENPSLEELGLTDEALSGRYDAYIKAMGLEDRK